MSGRITVVRTLRRKLENTEVTVVYSGILGKKTGFGPKDKDRILTVEEAERITNTIANGEQPLEGFDELEFEVFITQENGDQNLVKRISSVGPGYKGKSLYEENMRKKEEEIIEIQEEQEWNFKNQ